MQVWIDTRNNAIPLHCRLRILAVPGLRSALAPAHRGNRNGAVAISAPGRCAKKIGDGEKAPAVAASTAMPATRTSPFIDLRLVVSLVRSLSVLIASNFFLLLELHIGFRCGPQESRQGAQNVKKKIFLRNQLSSARTQQDLKLQKLNKFVPQSE